MSHVSPIVLAAAAVVLGTSWPAQIAELAIPEQASPAEAPPAVPAPTEPPEQEAAGLEKPVSTLTPKGMVYLPRGWHSAGGAFDVIVHFHGAPQVVEPELDRAGIRSALLTVNLGAGSGAYENSYSDEKALDRALEAVREVASKAESNSDLRVGRIAISSWSAGYGAVSRILGYPKNADAIDTVLLADGLHAAFVGGHELDPHKMAPFAALAGEASRGKKLFAVTHSEIPTYSYANTTETADYLLAAVGAARQARTSTVGDSMHESSSADAGDFHVRGFEGTDKEAHCQHLRQLGATLFPLLASRWSKPSAS